MQAVMQAVITAVIQAVIPGLGQDEEAEEDDPSGRGPGLGGHLSTQLGSQRLQIILWRSWE